MAKILKYIRDNKLLSKGISFVHDALYFDIYPTELFMMSDQILRQMNDYPRSEFNLPVKADLTVGTSLGSHLEVVEYDHSDDYQSGYYIVEGFEDDLDSLVENWKSVYKEVKVTHLKDPEPLYISKNELFVPKKTIHPSYGTYRNQVLARIDLVI